MRVEYKSQVCVNFRRLACYALAEMMAGQFGDQTSIKKVRVVWSVDLIVSFLSTFSMKCYPDRGSILNYPTNTHHINIDINADPLIKLDCEQIFYL
jgi:hypothetical protein